MSSASRPKRVAIVGSGPSGFYAAQALLDSVLDVRVDVFDRLATPYGLVRGGVAPDHQGIKATAKVYARVAEDERMRFFGNVRIGHDLAVEELDGCYDAVIWAVGCESGRGLDIPGADLDGVHTATEFVFWYNGHPDYTEQHFRLEDATRALVVGNGNVSMDVTRLLALKVEDLAVTDVADHALAVFRESAIRDVTVVGRRGPAQAAFSPKEVRDLGRLADVDLWALPEDVEMDSESAAWIEGRDLERATMKNIATVQELAPARGEAARAIQLRFLVSPVEYIGSDGKLTGVRCVRNRLERRGDRLSSVPTDETWVEPAQLVFQAIGYRGIPIPGVPYERWAGTIPNEAGRVVREKGGERIPGWYVVGWAKRGPSGLIGTNRGDSRATVAVVLDDAHALPLSAETPERIDELLSDVRVVTFEDWKRVDAEELRRGEESGRVRVKFTRTEDILAFLDA